MPNHVVNHMLSFISMHKDGWKKHSYAASCGVSDHVLWQMIKDNPNIKTVYLCRDNDEAGQLANKRTSDALFLKGIQHELLVPLHKDWNEDRLAAGDNAPHKDVCAEFFVYYTKLYQTDLPHRAKLVYIYLHDRMDKEKKAWPGLNTIAKDLSLSRSTVKRAVKDLEKAGLIRKEPHYRENGSATSNRYYLL